MRPARLPQQRRQRQGGPGRPGGGAGPGPAPRPGRGRHPPRRGHRPRLQPAVVHRHRAQPPADALRRRPLPDRLQRRDLQLPRAARASWPRAAPPSRPRATPRRSSPATTWGEDVVRELRGMFAFVIWDTEDADGLRRPRPVRHQAAVHHPTADGGIVFGSEKKALLELLGGSKAAGGVDIRVAAALPDAAVRAGAGDPAPAASAGSRAAPASRSRTATLDTRRYFHPTFPIRPVARTSSRRSTTGSPDVLDDSVADAHAGRRHGRRRSSPAASTPPRSPRWPSGTTRS